jgi:hypothetical protein
MVVKDVRIDPRGSTEDVPSFGFYISTVGPHDFGDEDMAAPQWYVHK